MIIQSCAIAHRISVSTISAATLRMIAAALLILMQTTPTRAGEYFATGYEYQLFPANTGDPNFEYVSLYGDGITVDGITRRTFDTGRRVSGLAPLQCSASPPVFAPVGFGRSAGAVDLASGSIALLGVSGGSWNYAGGGAQLQDTLFFQFPDGMTETEITATFTINGTYSSPAGGGHHVTGYAQLYLGGVSAQSENSSPESFVGQTFSVTLLVQQGIPYRISAWLLANLSGVADWCAGEIGSYNLSAFVDVVAPEGVGFRSSGHLFSSASNVFLTAADTDGDGTSDLHDNCTLTGNISQFDADNDGIGNRCDADLSNDCFVNFIDLSMMRDAFFSNDPLADLTTDGLVNFGDLALMASAFFGPPGPSSQACVPGR